MRKLVESAQDARVWSGAPHLQVDGAREGHDSGSHAIDAAAAAAAMVKHLQHTDKRLLMGAAATTQSICSNQDWEMPHLAQKEGHDALQSAGRLHQSTATWIEYFCKACIALLLCSP